MVFVPAHADDPLNNHVDALAKAAHMDSCLSSRPLLELLAPCTLQFNSLPVDMNIRKFIRDIFDAKSLLTLAVLPRFNSYSSTSDIDWASLCLPSEWPLRVLWFPYQTTIRYASDAYNSSKTKASPL
ncbi:hypothetical protein RhiirA5_445682 [Rhizophagus irregularis]|uniref:Uncharacterized protein n=1 Tax=Rhizophagus irregularis TaxID=588596 RepID=A0A2N0NC86_9GLOM|nr:hypothetical protein RhiirA5_445682 [Rhizophagus irregularis]